MVAAWGTILCYWAQIMGRDISTLIKFVVVGSANTVLGLASIFLIKWQLGFSDVFANLFGYMIGLAFNFSLNRVWTFRHSGSLPLTLIRYLLVFAFAYLINLATTLIAIRSFGINSYLAQVVGIVPYSITFYIGSRYYAFVPVSIREKY
jgi:putative flippase GtrA